MGVTVIVSYNQLSPYYYQRTTSPHQHMSSLHSEVDDVVANKQVKIFRWSIDSLQLIDSQRIFMQETISNGELNVRQSCAIESAAKHNPHRSIQLITRQSVTSQTFDIKDTPWLKVLNHYSNNVQVMLIEEAEYFNDTALNDWYNRRDWHSSSHRLAHLSDYIQAVSIFRGAGLYVDIDKVVVVKPLTGSKWNNFFVKLTGHDIAKSAYSTLTTGETFHLVHGHHLVDLFIANLADIPYDPRAPEHEVFSSVLDTTLAGVCGDIKQLANDDNHCLDVHLLEIQRVFVPHLDTFLNRPLFKAIRNATMSPSSVGTIFENFISSHEAVLLEWDSMESLKSHFDSKSYQQLCSSLLERYCPKTVAHRHLFLHSVLC